MPEVWFVHPTDAVVTVYRLDRSGLGMSYGRPTIYEMKGELDDGSVVPDPDG